MKDKLDLIVPEGTSGRIDAFLAGVHSELSRSYIRRLIDDGYVQVNGKKAKASLKIRPGDAIAAYLPEPEKLDAQPEDLPLDILYEDEDILVVNKAKGMVTHPAPGSPTGTLVNAVLSHCQDLGQINGTLRPGIVHRLDKDTSGVMVIAKNDLAQRSLTRQIAERTVHKEYEALVHGVPKPEKGTIRTNLNRSRRDYKKVVVAATGRPAVTHYEVLEDFGDFSRVRLNLETGRTHQIRVHMQHIGHPVAGDPVYGPKKGPFAGRGQFLHARRLAFRHPRDGREVEFTAPAPADFEEAAARMRASDVGAPSASHAES